MYWYMRSGTHFLGNSAVVLSSRVPAGFRQGYDQSALRSYNDRVDVGTLNVFRTRHPPWPI
jgi:hypothetical protein